MLEYYLKKKRDRLTEKAFGLEIVDYDLYLQETKKQRTNNFLLTLMNLCLYFVLGFIVGIAYLIT